MDNINSILILGILCILILIYLHVREKFTPSTSPKTTDINEIVVAYNKNKYQKYKTEREELLGDSNFKFGYSELPNTNPDTIGVCPLGQYYKGEFSNDFSDLSSKCKPCLDCSRMVGIQMVVIMGDKDGTCEFGRLPYGICQSP